MDSEQLLSAATKSRLWQFISGAGVLLAILAFGVWGKWPADRPNVEVSLGADAGHGFNSASQTRN